MRCISDSSCLEGSIPNAFECSMRNDTDISLEKNGFCYVEHESKYVPSLGVDTELVEKYRAENEELLRSFFKADFVHCYDYKVSMPISYFDFH